MRFFGAACTLAVGTLLSSVAAPQASGQQPAGQTDAARVSKNLKPIELAETFDIAGGKAKAITASLPRGSKVEFEVKVLSGPAVDVHVMDESNYKLFTQPGKQFQEQADLTHTGAVEYKRSSSLPAGTWYIVTHAPGHEGKLIEVLVVDAGAAYLSGGISLIKTALDLAKHKEGEPVSRVQIKLTIEQKPAPIVQAGAIAIDQEFTVEAHKEHFFTLPIAPGATPGRLIGMWASEGKSAGIKGANDDTLVSFQIKGPDNNVVTPEMKHQVTGNFSIGVSAPGVYTFVFNNSGLIRSSARHVTLKGLYQPE